MKDKTPKKPKTNKAANPASPPRGDQNHTLLGQILVELSYITIYQLDEALQIQRAEYKKDAKPLGQVLLELGYCSPNQLIRAIKVQSDYRQAAGSHK